MPPCALWRELRSIFSSKLSIMINNLFATKFFTAYFIFSMITSSFLLGRLFVRRLSCSTSSLSLVRPATYPDHSFLSSFNDSFHATISTSPLPPVLTVSNTGMRKMGMTALRFFVGGTVLAYQRVDLCVMSIIFHGILKTIIVRTTSQLSTFLDQTHHFKHCCQGNKVIVVLALINVYPGQRLQNLAFSR